MPTPSTLWYVAERLQDVGIQALSIHGRTRAQNVQGRGRLGPDWRGKEQPAHAISPYLAMVMWTAQKKLWL